MSEEIIYWDDPVLKRGISTINTANIEQEHKKLLKKIDKLIARGEFLKARNLIRKALQ